MDFLGDLIGGAVGDAVADKVGKGWRRAMSRALVGQGAGCGLRLISGSQDDLSQNWRLGTAQFAPGELRFTQHRTSLPPIAVLGALETPDRVTMPVLGNCLIAQLQTPTATLALAMPSGPLASALQDLAR
jgi:hypothetical protein